MSEMIDTSATSRTTDTIARVEAFMLTYGEPHYRGLERWVTLVRIETADGAVGWGEGLSQLRGPSFATKAIIDETLAPLILGGDPYNVESHWHKMYRHSYWYGREGIAAFAISGIDMALWDLK